MEKPSPKYLRKALLDELQMSNAYSPTSPLTLTGNLDAVGFSSNTGTWNLALTVRTSNGRSMSATESYSFTTSFYGETACNQTAQALMPAVQNLVGRIVRSIEFQALVSP